VAYYCMRRLLGVLPTLLLVSIIVFLLARLAPGDPASQVLGSYATPAELQQMRVQLGLTRPLYVQFFIWLDHAVQGDLGQSINANVPVLRLLLEALPRTAGLALLALVVSVLTGVPLGVYAGTRPNSWRDQVASGISLIGLSIPDFVVGMLFIIVFAVKLDWLPAIGYAPFSTEPLGWLAHMLLPGVSLGLLMTAVTARMTRSCVIEVMSQDFVLTARAKGLSENRVIFRHVLKAAMIPVITVIGINLGSVFRGAVVIETLFAIPGIGTLLVNSIAARDYPVIQGVLLAAVLIYVLINMIVDLAYAWLDPRIRLS
jgi:peptide/nickel transport system permease protein